MNMLARTGAKTHGYSIDLIIKITAKNKMKQKSFLNEIEHDKLYPSGSAAACIYGTPKMHKFSSSDSFPKLPLIVSSIGNFNYNL